MLKLTLFQKLFISILSVTVACGITTATLTYQRAKRDMFQRDNEVFLKTTIDLSREINNLLTYGRSVSQMLAAHSRVKDYMSLRSGDTVQILKVLEDHNINKMFSAFYLVDMEGFTLLSTDASFVGHNFGFRNYFNTAVKGGAGVDAGVGTISRRMGYYFSYPIYSNDNSKIIGVAVAKMEPQTIHANLEVSDFGFDSNKMITNDNGVILFSEKPERVFWSLAPLTDEQMKIEQETRFINRKIEALTYEQVQAEVINYNNPTVIEFYDKGDKNEEIVATSKVGDFPFFIVIEAERDMVLKHITDQITPIVLFVFIAIVFEMILIGILLYIFLKPIEKIRSHTQRLAKKERAVSLELKTGDELEDIVDSINKIANR